MSAQDNAATALAAVLANLAGPQSVEGDAGKVVSQPIPDQILAANYLAGIAAAGNRNRGLRFNVFRPGATVQGARLRPSWQRGFEW